MINRKTFYDGYRAEFGSLSETKYNAIEFLLTKLDQSGVFNLASEYAYILATIKHETAETFLPITEYGSQSYLRGKKYYPYIGRGYVQLTWQWNYEKFGDLLNIPLVKNPELANDPETAWRILETGMSRGLYTGRKLRDYVNEKKTDYYRARKVINGLDKATLIKKYAEKFYDCIEFV